MAHGKVSAAACQHTTACDEGPAHPACIFRLFLSRALIAGFDFSGLKLHFCLLSEGKKIREATPVALIVSEPDSYISARNPVKPLEMYQTNLCRAIIFLSLLASYPL